MATNAVDNIDFDQTDARHVQDPGPVYHALHERCPVARSSHFGGYWVLSKFEDVSRAARDVETFSSAQGFTIPVLHFTIPLVPVGSDPPSHGEFRRTLQQEFSANRMVEIEATVREVATQLIDTFIDKGQADLAQDLAAPLPPIVLAHLMGFPRDEWVSFRSSTQRLLETAKVGDEEGNREAAAAFSAHLSETLEDRRQNPRDDMLTRIVQSTVDGRTVNEAEALGMTWTAVIAGHETTVGGIGGLLMHVARDEELRRRLTEEPNLIPRAVQETVRLEAPIQGTARTVTTPVCVRDQQFAPGDKVWLAFAASSRDEEVFIHPDEFRLDRRPNPHHGFGDGIHRCVGAPLAQLEMRVALEEILRRMPDYRITDWNKVKFGGVQSRTLSALPAAWTPPRSDG